MSQKATIGIGIAVVAALLLGGGYYWYSMQQQAQPASPEVTTLPTWSDSSDTAIDQDLAAIDTQIQAVSEDTANADSSVSTAVAQ